jgi:bacterioferritin-associated ferredoxin
MTLSELITKLTEIVETVDGDTPVKSCCGNCFNGKTFGELQQVVLVPGPIVVIDT